MDMIKGYVPENPGPDNWQRRKGILEDLLDEDLAFNAGFPGGFNVDTAILLQILRELRKR